LFHIENGLQPCISARYKSPNNFHLNFEWQNNLQVQQKGQLPTGNNVRTTRGSLNRSQSQNKEGNSTPNFISPKHLLDAAAKKRSGKKS